MNRLIAVLVATAVALLGVTFPLAAPAASALKMFCTSSIDPRCQPQNLPILIEAGIISSGGSTATTAAATGSAAAAGTATGSLSLGGGALAGMGGFGICTLLMDGICGPASLGAKGLSRQIIKTDPTWTNASAGSKLCGSSGSTSVLQGTAGPQPPVYQSTSTMEPGCDHLSLGGTQWTIQSVNLAGANPVITVLRTSASTSSVVLRRWCAQPGAGVNGTGAVATFTAGSSSPLTVTDTAAACAVDRVLIYAITGTTFGSTIPFYVLYGNGHVYTAPGPNTIVGTMSGTVECTSATGPRTVTFSFSVSITAGEDIAIPDVLCDADEVATGTEVEFAPSTGGTPVEVIPPTSPDPIIGDLPVDYPDCFGPAVNSCRLELWKVGPGGDLEFCGSIGQLCLGWASTPGAETRYQCKYGHYVLPLDACSAYRDPTVGVLPNWDPATSDWFPYNAPVPSPLPNDTGTGGLPGVDLDGEITYSECWPSGWGALNPLAWVFQPVRCALEWAFVPRQSVMVTYGAEVTLALADTSVGQVAAMVSGWDVDPSLTGCKISFVHWDTGQVIDVVNACDGPMADLAALSRLLTFVSACVLAVGLVRRQIAGIVDYQGH